MVELKGITWNHTRGYLPMVATAQRFSELHSDVAIHWEKRSLQQFADMPLDRLTAEFDLLVIDHPSIGEAAEENLLIRLDEHLEPEFLREQAEHSVGQSHASYNYGGHQYAMAIDAATPVSGYRPDLMAKADAELPETWEDLLNLARKGLVTVPAIPIDSLMNVFMLSNALGSEPFSSAGQALDEDAGSRSLELLRELVGLSAPGSLERNPIRTWQLLADSDKIAYCPFAYGYSNYSRLGYAQNLIQAGGLVSLNGRRLRSTLGGAGLAVSRTCRDLGAAMEYVRFVSCPLIQRTLYCESGGQPGHRSAWTDPAVNSRTANFFSSTLATLDEAWVRPRFPGFIAFQDAASLVVHEYLSKGGDARLVIHRINDALAQTRKDV